MKNKKLLVCAMIGALVLSGCGKKAETASDESVQKSEVSQKTEEIIENEPELSKAEMMLEEMTLEEKVGQMFFARFPQEDVLGQIENYHTGGYIVFGRDFENSDPQSFRAMIDECQDASDIPMLIGVDEEGGIVVRASKYPQFRKSAFKSPQDLYAEGGIERIAEDAREKSEFLKDLGINVNLAPVVDVSTDSSNYIYGRTLGKDAQETAEYAVAVTKAMNESGMGSVLKHFPGYGANLDTHEGKSIDSRSLEYLSENDLVPFAKAVENGAKAILVSHNVVEAFDKENPATLSPDVHKFIRSGLGFDGVIMTDDLEMGAMGEYSIEDVVVMAVKAGNDMIITSDLVVHHMAIVEAVETGEIDEKVIDEAALKILQWKIELGIIE
ncbi:MAG: beta-hexosaminidase [Firmicutes bacterium]|nr:beta-hexosaminidase [Bacillota bacterium]